MGREATYFQKGNPGGPGRPKGSGRLTKRQREELEAMEQEMAEHGWETPVQFFARVMNDVRLKLDVRMNAAVNLAPYVHRKMPVGIEVTPPGVQRIADPMELKALSPDELDMMLLLQSKMDDHAAGVIEMEG